MNSATPFDDWNTLAAAWDRWQAEGGGDPSTTETGRHFLELFNAWVDAAQRPAHDQADR